MNQQELTDKYINIIRKPTAVELLIMDRRKPPELKCPFKFIQARKLPPGAGDREIFEAVTALLADRRFFRYCTMCGELCALAWMVNKTMCPDCTKKYFPIRM